MTTNKMWGGRFKSGPAAIMEEINTSIDIDKRLWVHDLEGSDAHAAMLAASRIIGKADADAIRKGLKTIGREIRSGKFPFRREFEDIHMNVEARLAELIGEAAGRLHTARSRNDQVATDFRLFVREACAHADKGLLELQRALRQAGPEAREDDHARLHPHAAGAAGHVRASLPRLRRDVRARPRALRRCQRSA